MKIFSYYDKIGYLRGAYMNREIEESVLSFYGELFEKISFYEIQEKEIIEDSIRVLRNYLIDLKRLFWLNLKSSISASIINQLRFIDGTFSREECQNFQKYLSDFRKESIEAKRLVSKLLSSLHLICKHQDYYYLSTIYSCFCDLFLFQQEKLGHVLSRLNSMTSFSSVEESSGKQETLVAVEKKIGTIQPLKYDPKEKQNFPH